ncbi:uncharacterized protein LOC144574275 isoform X3 [Carex rostrata]
MHVARSTAQCSGLIFFNRCQTRTPIGKVSKVKLPLIKVSAPIIRQTFPLTNLKECAATGRDGTKNVYYDDKFDPDPFWSSLIKEILWCLRDLFQFLAEQPSQLKYIEWPSFQRTPCAIFWLGFQENLHRSISSCTDKELRSWGEGQ